jgi:CheY-like chemotaxis protein
VVLIADDDEDDLIFAEKAIKANAGNQIDIRLVKDGEELLDYLYKRNKFSGIDTPKPSIIFLDIKMPKVSGIDALEIIKNDDYLKSIPIIILSSSKEDVEHGYKKGANSYIVKPDIYIELESIMNKMKKFWFEAAKLPGD